MNFKLDRIAMAPMRAAARSGRGILADEAERAVDAVFAGPMPEAIGRSLAEHDVLERVVSEFIETAAPDGIDAEAIERAVRRAARHPSLSGLTEDGEVARLAETAAAAVVRSPAFKLVLTEVLSSPELRGALAQQSTGFAADVGAAMRRRAGRLDDRLGKTPRPVYGGLATRGIALVIDAAIAQLAFLVIAGSISLVIALAGGVHEGWLAATLAAVGWFVVEAAYFVGFWSAAGVTPGMRVLRLRVVTRSGGPLSVPRAILRYAGLLLAIAPLFAGFLPVLFDARRRALQDFIAATVVVRDHEAYATTASPQQPS
jgi:uncharacterized RDD family membrane protein YckC